MLDIQLLPQISKNQFKAVILVKERASDKDNWKNADACVSAIVFLKSGGEIVFLPAPEKEKISFAYAEQTSRFVHRIEKGIYALQSKNKRLKAAKHLEVIAAPLLSLSESNGVSKKRFEL